MPAAALGAAQWLQALATLLDWQSPVIATPVWTVVMFCVTYSWFTTEMTLQLLPS